MRWLDPGLIDPASARLPASRISPAVHDSEHNDLRFLDPEVDPVGEPLQNDSANRLVNHREG